MSTLLAPVPALDLAAALRWLPVPYHRPAGAVCPACGAADRLMHSISQQYVACVACGWQRRLAAADRLTANLAGATGSVKLWDKLLTDLAKSDPDPQPPVAALLWRRLDATHWAGPSRTQPDTQYTITQYASGHVHCTCPHLGRGCWHRQRGAELGLEDRTTAADLF